MFGRLSEEKGVKVPPSEAWELYGTLKFVKIVSEALQNIVSKIEVVEGDGGPGTILRASIVPGKIGGLTTLKEKYTVVDNEKRVKEVQVMEGGYLDFGFTLYRIRFEVNEKEGEENECVSVTRTTIEYEVNDEVADTATTLVSIKPMVAIMQVAADYLHQNHNIK